LNSLCYPGRFKTPIKNYKEKNEGKKK
jgi:hypothetical protein